MKKTTTAAVPKDKLLPRLTLSFFKRPKSTALIWLVLVVFGAMSYSTFLKREGFPSINIPLVIVTGSYAVDNAAEVDSKVAAPVSQIALKQAGAKTVQATSEDNFFSATVQYDEKTNPQTAQKDLEKAVKNANVLPASAKLTFTAPQFGVTGGSLKKIDATISVYATNGNPSLPELTDRADAVVKYLNRKKLPEVQRFFVQSPYESVTNPVTGQQVSVQRTFDRYGVRQNSETAFHQSVIIGVTGTKGSDAIKLDNQLKDALASLAKQPQFKDVRTAISASYAPSIREEISELQRVLMEGLLAVLVIASILIAVRASAIIVVSMITVISIVLGLLFVIGYSLNVITLFALILGLSLIVDDTIIMTEAIDASRKRAKSAREAVMEATRKISRAMVAATFTAVLSFAPLLFVGGILGTFIRAIPVTIISALLISLLVALVFIPLFAKILLLGKKQLGEKQVHEVAAGIEHRIAVFIGKPMLWAKHSRRKEFTVGIIAVVIGLGFIFSAGYVFKYVTFNIFPPTKDTNQLSVTLTYKPGISIAQAQDIADKANKLTAKTLGSNFVDASYYGMANNQSAALYVNIIPYENRTVTSPELVAKLNKAFTTFDEAKVTAAQLDVGPPSAGFTVDIRAADREKAITVANDMQQYLDGRKLTRPDGSIAKIKDVSIDNTSIYKRTDNKPVISVNATFDGDDTTTLTDLAKKAVNDKYTATYLKSFGLKKSDVTFNLGQEQENQDSFKTLALAFPLVLFVIYILLAIQFRSLLQPLLIFMALPFSLLGVTLGLYLTNNAFSFFAMLGFFALIGLSIKNTILLTDYANQARRAGMGPIDAAVAALGERFRPLIATSITAVVSLIPLAITSPFWQGLAVVLIFGLISSTFLVVTVFPYYYLGAEYLRWKISRRGFLKWLVLNAAVVGAVGAVTKKPVLGLFIFVALNTLLVFRSRQHHQQQK